MSASGQAASSLLGLVSSFLGDDGEPPAPTAAAPLPSPLPESNVTRGAASDEEETIENQHSHVKVVIFSKDRPWQLQQLFRSMRLGDETCHSDDITISLELLVHITETYQTAYKQVIESVENMMQSVPRVSLTCHYEDSKNSSYSFQSLLEGILTTEEDKDSPNHWMFVTDDCLLLISLRELLETATGVLFSNNTHAKCFLSRLHPGITWTQTRSLPSPPPRSFLRYHPGRTPYHEGAYSYPLNRGQMDWAYPWDLSGGIYTNLFVQSVFEKLQGTSDSLSHPNRMEIAGNQAIAEFTKKNDIHVAVPTRPMLLILAINRVQDVCQAPLACNETDTLNPEALLTFYKDKKQLDIVKYKALHFNASHVGDIHLLSGVNEDGESDATTNESSAVAKGEETKPALSVLIPVHTGPAQAAAQAIRSIVLQPIEEFRSALRRRKPSSVPAADTSVITSCLSPMQIVIVDDRCTDGSTDEMLETIRDIAAKEYFVNVSIHDYRFVTIAGAVSDDQNTSSISSETSRVELVVDVFPSPRPGVAAALNHGLSRCQSELVARMDADDIADPGRLQAQVSALRYQPDVDVVGTSTLLFREKTALDSSRAPEKANVTRLSIDALPYSLTSPNDGSTMHVATSLPPTDAGFASWAMLFSCSVAHPSVVYRKEAISKAGGYDEAYSGAEDYELWLQLTTLNCGCLVSIPRIGLWHRKHRSKSQRTTKQSDEALQASIVAMELTLGRASEWSRERLAAAASIVRQPDAATLLQEVNEAADLLVSLEIAFLQCHGKTLTSREIALVRKDCSERLGDLAILAVQRPFIDPSEVNSAACWKIWCERTPELTMQRVALLCHGFCADQT